MRSSAKLTTIPISGLKTCASPNLYLRGKVSPKTELGERKQARGLSKRPRQYYEPTRLARPCAEVQSIRCCSRYGRGHYVVDDFVAERASRFHKLQSRSTSAP